MRARLAVADCAKHHIPLSIVGARCYHVAALNQLEVKFASHKITACKLFGYRNLVRNARAYRLHRVRVRECESGL